MIHSTVHSGQIDLAQASAPRMIERVVKGEHREWCVAWG